MQLFDLIPDPQTLIDLEPDELGLRMLPALNRGLQQEPLQLDRFVASVIGDSRLAANHPASAGSYPPQHRAEIEQAIREAWAWLEGQALLVEAPRYMPPHSVRKLSRRALRLAKEPDARRVFAARRIAKEMLHPSIREDVWELYHRGKYDTAVLEAMKAVEVAVRRAGKYKNADYGTDMIARAFNENTGPLRDPSAEPAERAALRNLFVGAHGSYKNPHSHRKVPLDDPDEAAEIIMLANHLLRIVDSRAESQP